MPALIPTPDTATDTFICDPHVASVAEEHRAEYRRMVRALAGPLDNGHTANFILTPADFNEMTKDKRCMEMRRRILEKRRADMEAFARGEVF